MAMPLKDRCGRPDSRTLFCPGCKEMLRNSAGEQVLHDVAQPRQGCVHLWCSPCINAGMLGAVRSAKGIFECPRCHQQIISYDTRRSLPAQEPAPPPAKQQRGGADSNAASARGSRISYTSVRLGDPDRVLAPPAVREFNQLVEGKQSGRSVISITELSKSEQSGEQEVLALIKRSNRRGTGQWE